MGRSVGNIVGCSVGRNVDGLEVGATDVGIFDGIAVLPSRFITAAYALAVEVLASRQGYLPKHKKHTR